jgi:diaminohydroxyphosphoribosylaminopyrimidine deaminase/5-amino-6-(5-phosphoribosylamino)uracil reductase
VLALEQAGNRARGGTLYINLEPHAHQGRTPPCTDALIAAGIRRVVACMADPNPKVSGKGFERLHSADVEVEVGQFEGEARRLNEAFARHIRHGIPFVMLKSAMTLDGKIAPTRAVSSVREPGIPAGGWITGESAREHVQLQRHASDAILAGVGTILADDPLLTDRSGKARRRPLLRVILDSHLRLPLESRVLRGAASNGASNNDVLIFCSPGNETKRSELEAHGIRVEQVASAQSSDRLDIHAVLRRLGELEIASVMIEGGASINATAISSGVVDKIFFYYAPRILGPESIPFAAGADFLQPDQARHVKHLKLYRFEEDFAVEGYLRDPYAELSPQSHRDTEKA